MIIRDGRRTEHDLGPRRVFEPSMMKMVGGIGSTGAGKWTSTFMTVIPREHHRRSYVPVIVLLDALCPVCDGRIYTANPTAAKFCSTRCRNRAAKKAQRERNARSNR